MQSLIGQGSPSMSLLLTKVDSTGEPSQTLCRRVTAEVTADCMRFLFCARAEDEDAPATNPGK
ncbi:MAG: hypothetical protein CBB71_11440 [Rhodopirellula sp. TMED11]|nr:MAG: hypothetical protein CBB71_11440 [Rhodopirellula sp. TMED11]